MSHQHQHQNPRDSFSSAGLNDNDMDSDDEIVDTKPGKGKDGEKGDKKGIINRVNRACNNCRRMKMRCVGAEDPPCKRCRNAGLDCVMEKPGRSSGEGGGEDRIRSLEGQVSAIQTTLTDLVSTLRAGMAQKNNPPAAAVQTPTTIDPSPENLQNISQSQSTNQYSSLPQASPSGSNPFDPNSFNFALQSQMFPGTMSHRSPSYSAFPPGAINFGFPPRQDVIRFDGSDASSVNSRNQPSPYQLMMSGGEVTRPSPQDQPQMEGAFRRPALPVSNFPPPQPVQPVEISLPPSRAGSVGAEDILGPEHITNPLGVMSSMAGLVEAAEERARDERGGASIATIEGEGSKRKAEDGRGDGSSAPVKKARFSPTEPSGPAVLEDQRLPWKPGPSTKGKGKPKRKHIHAYPDAVAEGLVSEEEGRELLSLYYAGSSNFVPCFDPAVDTWEALRLRSPFSITAIMMVGARVRDGGGPISDVQRSCRQHAQRIGVGTLFNPVARIEAVQAMILMAAFNENGWMPGGHAVRMAVDMGINRSFVALLRSGMGKGKSPEELEEERHLVVQSRVWFCLYLVEHQMAYGMGRPAILREDESIHQCRRLLEHPLSIMSDARLVSTVELTALRAPLHIELTASPDLPIAEHTLRRLKQANADFDAWERYWDRVLSERFGKNRGDFFRESLIIQRQYAELFVNSQLLRGIRESTDVTSMPEEKRALAIRAMRNAQRCLEICLRGENYRNGLRYAVHYTHVCAAFAASFLIRIARLFPNELNLKKTAKDVEELAGILSEVPAGRYARSLRLILRRARKAKVIPAASAISSPNKLSAPLPLMSDGSQPPAFSPSQLVNPAYHGTPNHQYNPANLSPNSILFNATQQMMNDSPNSGTELFEFDQLFAQETLERAGLSMGEGNQLPLFLDGQSLGASQGATETTPFVGMESFFLPAEVDFRLGGSMGSGETGGQQNGGSENPLGGDVWW